MVVGLTITVTLPSMPVKVQMKKPPHWILEILRGLPVRSNVRIRCVGAANDAKILMGCMLPSVGKHWEKDPTAPMNVQQTSELRALTEAWAA